MRDVEIVLGLLVAVALLVTLSRRVTVPYPIVLVFGGLVLALVPGLPSIELKPELVFLLFLPPLLYQESLAISLRDFQANLRPIFSLAIGLVLATMAVVAIVAHLVIPGLTWPVAFVLGAILAPTDEVAVAEVAERLSIPPRVLIIVEGESLINDAISLVAYRMAITAAVTGLFSFGSGSLRFLAVGLGGAGIGLAVGWGIARIRVLLHADPPVENTISLLTPFAAYLPADALGASGVLAVVTVGIYLGRQGPRLISSETRLQAQAMWEMLAFLLNGLLFILTGLQLRQILHSTTMISLSLLFRSTALIVLTLIAVRIAWVFAQAYLPRKVSRSLRERDPYPSWKSLLLLAWTGIRGGISLVTALAIPFTLVGGVPFPQRNLLICIAFSVILVTLVLEGLTLPALIRRLRIVEDEAPEREEAQARLAAARAALAHLDAVVAKSRDGQGSLSEVLRPGDDAGTVALPEEEAEELIADLREHYTARAKRFSARTRGRPSEVHESRAQAYRNLRQELLHAERNAVLQLRDAGVINDDALRRVQQDLDHEEVRLGVFEEG